MSRLFSSAAVVAAVVAATSVSPRPVRCSGPWRPRPSFSRAPRTASSSGSTARSRPALRPTARLTTTPAQIWSLAAAPDGTLWAGTGGDGRVIRLRPGQAEETVFTAEEKNIFAIATSGTRVYFATGPEGKVYVIDGTAAPRVFFDPSEKYIWALAVDRTGRLWVGAGNPAVVYRVDAGGTSQVVYRPPAAHVVVARARRAGPHARRHRIAGPAVPIRSRRPAVRPARFGPDRAARDRRRLPEASSTLPRSAKGDDASSSAGESASVAIATAPPPTPGASTPSSSGGGTKSVVYRIDAAGTYETFWETQRRHLRLGGERRRRRDRRERAGRPRLSRRPQPAGAAHRRCRREADHASGRRGSRRRHAGRARDRQSRAA